MKAKSIKKIVGIVLVSIVLAITITTIILALVPKKLYNPIADKDFYGVTIWRSTVVNSYYPDKENLPATDEQNVVPSELMELIEESVQDNILSSMFQGALGHKIEITKTSKNSDLEKLYNSTGVLALVFNYFGENDTTDYRTLKINGEVYKHETYHSSTTIEYNQIIMPLNNSDSFEECTLYFVKSGTSEYTMTYHAHQSDIWNYIVNDDKLDWNLVEG